jgi:threonyl-tRNA synthetase
MEKDKQEDLRRLRHSAAHVMAQAVKHLFPDAKVTIGPPTADGFYYDFDNPTPFTPEDLARIEEEMRRCIQANYPFERRPITKPEALALFTAMEEPYKVEMIAETPDDEPMSVYQQGDFVDWCRGPHVERTGEIGAFKLLNVAGAYWRGDERNKMLQRIYGTAFFTQEELDDFLRRLAEAEKRDHRKLGRDLDLYSVSEEIGPGLILWHPKGARVRQIIEEFWRAAHYAHGYELVATPHIGRAQLWKTSGHLDFYAESMFSPIEVEGQQYFLKPMNCPFHIQIFRSRLRSYRDLPLRWSELGTVYRYERSGVLHGLTRVRGFTQDDAHIFCTPEQVEEEIQRAVDFALYVMRAFGFEQYEIFLSTRPEKSVGEPERWETATSALRRALASRELPYEVDEGGGAFYGPKIDLNIRDALGRNWQCSTIQFDFNLPEKFDLQYMGSDGGHHRPYMVHRALLGSMERFFGVLIEHFGGAFPLWLAPVQFVILPIADRHHDYSRQVLARLQGAGFRAELDARNEKIGHKIREAQLQKVPYMLVVGDKEASAGTVAVRSRDAGDLGPRPVDELLQQARAELGEHARSNG